jgi:rSAM/selenodomain-associated transferase 2
MISVSVIIPTLDEARVLEATLEAVQAELAGNDEVWVVDAGSRDRTREIAASRAKLLASPGPRGRQLNEGAARARGDVLLFLHADCRLSRGALEAVRRAMADPAVAGGCFTVVFPEPELRRAPVLEWIERGINARTRLLREGTGDQGIFTRREAFLAAGGFREWPLMEDLELCSRLKRGGRFRILVPPIETSARRWLRRGVLRTQLLMWSLRLAYMLGVPPETLGRRYAAIR